MVDFLPPHIGQRPIGPDFDPVDASFSVANLQVHEQVADRLDDRMSLLKSLDQFRRDVTPAGKWKPAIVPTASCSTAHF